MCSHLTHLGSITDILCLQETQLLELALGWVLKTHKIFYNNAIEGQKGGVGDCGLQGLRFGI